MYLLLLQECSEKKSQLIHTVVKDMTNRQSLHLILKTVDLKVIDKNSMNIDNFVLKVLTLNLFSKLQTVILRYKIFPMYKLSCCVFKFFVLFLFFVLIVSVVAWGVKFSYFPLIYFLFMQKNLLAFKLLYIFYRRRRAKERQQKLMAEFASKQKAFMQKTLETGE